MSFSRAIVVAVFGIILAFGAFAAWRGVMADRQADQVRLRETMTTAAPILAVLARARAERGGLPRSAGDVTGLLPDGVVADDVGPVIRFDVGAPPGWLYALSPDGEGFQMSRKLDQDARLVYLDEKGRGSWAYDPGDGGDLEPVELQP